MQTNVPLFYRLTGSFSVCPEAGEREKFLNLLLKNGIPGLPEKGGGYRIPLRCRKKMVACAKNAALHLKIGEAEGLPGFIWRYRARVGVLIGIILFLFLLFIGTNVVWRVDVEGTDAAGALQIKEELGKMGFGVGSYIPAENFTALAGRYRAMHPEIAWMSIYCVGTVAEVRVIPAEKPQENSSPPVANLIAAEDGVITEVQVSHGTPCVKVGQVVKKGDLLISGVVPGANADTLLCAEGKVKAALEKEITVEIPRKQTKTVTFGNTLSKIGINFFGKSINISLNTGKTDATYGTIERESFLSLPGGVKLPLSLTLSEGVLYREEEVTLTEREAVRLAYEKLKAALSATLCGGAVLQKAVSVRTDGETCTLVCHIRYETDIARLAPVEVN